MESGTIKTTSNRRGMFGRRQPTGFSNVFVCQLLDGVVQGVHLRRRRGDCEARRVAFASPEDSAGLSELFGQSCPKIVLLAKSQYMIRVLDIPKVLPEEVASMLTLEVESTLPPEFGSFELSYRQLTAQKQNYDRYEAYITRRDFLQKYLASLAGFGIEADLVLPSAVAWAGWFETGRDADICATTIDANSLEVASSCADGAVVLRTINIGSGLRAGLTEFIRPFLAHSSSDDRPLLIDWLGGRCPDHLGNSRITFRDVSSTLPRPTVEGGDGIDENCLLLFSAAAVLDFKHKDAFQTCNLLPREAVVQQQLRTIYKTMIAAATTVLVGLLLLFIALKVAIFRCKTVAADLTGQIALIKTEGESVGRRIEQLKVIRTARATRNDFHDILDGLYSARPSDDVTYSHIELGEDGLIRLRGQAASVDLPFVLPSQLERQPMFEKVLLRDAGQVRKAGGTITEFRIDCYLKRCE